ncbi:MAG: hypothetical protein AB1609_09490 [Bacillota bacterium]
MERMSSGPARWPEALVRFVELLAAAMPEGEALRRVIGWPALHLDPALCSGAEPELADADQEIRPS